MNPVELRDELRDRSVQLSSISDSELIATLIPTHQARPHRGAVADVVPRLEGALSTVVMTPDAVIAFRNPLGSARCRSAHR